MSSATGSAGAAVIGSGFGGLAAAIRLQAAGLPTTLFEARPRPGGRAYVMQRDGFTFDMGPTVITAPTCLEELFALAGIPMAERVELLPVDPLYRLRWADGDTFDYAADESRLLQQIEARNAADRDGYLRFARYSKQVFAAGYEQLAAEPFLRFWDMVRVAPQLVGLRADRSVYAAVSRYITDEKVRQALSFHSLLVGGNPYETSAIYTLIHHLERRWGVLFPRGGTGVLVRALATLFEGLGGRLLLSSPVRKIAPRRGGVDGHDVSYVSGGSDGSDRSDKTEHFDVVVSNADVHHTYSRLLGDTAQGSRMQRKLERAEWSMSLFVLYFGTDCDYRDQMVHHMVAFGPRYRELLTEIFHGAALPRDFSLYVHAPHLTDPSLAPPGCGSFYALAPVPHLGNAALDWEHIAPQYAERILASLEAVMPDLRAHVVVKEWMTPNDFAAELNAYQGSAFSLTPRLTQSAYFRLHNRDPRITGLYFAGAGTHPGAGIPGVVNSAKATAQLVLGDLAGGPAGGPAGAS